MFQMILLLTVLTCSLSVYAQDDIESTIRKLEQTEKNAVLKKDTATLRKLWSADYINNAPSNKVVHSGKTNVDRPVINQLRYSSFERNIEDLLIKDNVAICMGNEIVIPVTDNGTTSKPVKRRYTNIWMKDKDDQWKLTARHANEICQQ